MVSNRFCIQIYDGFYLSLSHLYVCFHPFSPALWKHIANRWSKKLSNVNINSFRFSSHKMSKKGIKWNRNIIYCYTNPFCSIDNIRCFEATKTRRKKLRWELKMVQKKVIFNRYPWRWCTHTPTPTHFDILIEQLTC